MALHISKFNLWFSFGNNFNQQKLFNISMCVNVFMYVRSSIAPTVMEWKYMIYVANSYIQFDVFFTTLLASLVIDEYYIDLGRQRDTEILQLRLDELCFLNDCSLCQIYSWDDFDGGSFVISKFYPFLKFVYT